MRKLIGLVALSVVSLASAVSAQVPIVQVYLDAELQTIHRKCPPFGTEDTLYVAASNFPWPIADIEYRVETYGNFAILEDLLPVGYSSDGYSATGIRVSFNGPVDASGTIVVQRILGGWFCNDCGGPTFPYIAVKPHPDSGKIQATRWPNLVKIEGTGGFNALCGDIAVESSTWGSIKALYR